MNENENKNYLDQYDSGDPSFQVTDEGIIDSELGEEQILDIQKLIGELVFGFNELESDLDRLIAEIINSRTHIPGYTITSEVGSVFTKKILIFKSLYGQFVHAFKNEEYKKEYDDLLSLLFSIKDVRNDVVHANWSGSNADYEVKLRISTDDKGPYAITKKMSPDYINIMIDKIYEAIEKIGIFDSHRDELLAYDKILKEEDYEK